jgi:hypothetical protein
MNKKREQAARRSRRPFGSRGRLDDGEAGDAIEIAPVGREHSMAMLVRDDRQSTGSESGVNS